MPCNDIQQEYLYYYNNGELDQHSRVSYYEIRACLSCCDCPCHMPFFSTRYFEYAWLKSYLLTYILISLQYYDLICILHITRGTCMLQTFKFVIVSGHSKEHSISMDIMAQRFFLEYDLICQDMLKKVSTSSYFPSHIKTGLYGRQRDMQHKWKTDVEFGSCFFKCLLQWFSMVGDTFCIKRKFEVTHGRAFGNRLRNTDQLEYLANS